MAMNLFEPVTISLTQLMANKLRSILSLIGILIAVGAVTGIVSIGEGLEKVITAEFEKMGGFNLIATWPPNPEYRNESGAWIRRTWEEFLTQKDIDEIMVSTDKIKFINPHIQVYTGSESNISHGSVATFGRIVSTTPYYLQTRDIEVVKGRYLNFQDVRNNAKVCVLGYNINRDLFGENADPVDKEVRIGGSRYKVIGAMGKKEFFDNPWNDEVYIPVTTAQMRITGNDRYNWMNIMVKNREDVPEVVELVKRVYRRIHEHGEDFNFQTGESELEEINQVLFIMKAVAGGVAGISLVVGCIGIMNIMLVSVTERTREIGLRKALGATKSNILWQFVIEAMVLCVVGGLLGIGLGLLLGKGIALYITSVAEMAFVSVIPPSLMIGTVAFSMLFGVVAGVYPAWRASTLDPVEALRDE